jgi:nitronate monooxygenase
MSPAAGGRLAAALSNAGALGIIGTGSRDAPESILRDADDFRASAGEKRFGIGLMSWAVAARPELLDAAIAARPFAISLSFGDPTPHVKKVHDAGIQVISQVQTRASALVAEAAGVDLIVAQGTEAGGHTGDVGTLPLLQIVLDAVKLPVVAAGGIATGRGLAAVLAAGAAGAWIGTPFLVAEEARTSERARERFLRSDESQTTLTSVFDRAQDIPWPHEFRGRALANDFSARWNGREDALSASPDAKNELLEQKRKENYDVAFLYAGQSVGTLHAVRPAADIAREIADGAEPLLRNAASVLG